MGLEFKPFLFSDLNQVQETYQSLLLPYQTPLYDPTLQLSQLIGVEVRVTETLVGFAVIEWIPINRLARLQSFLIKEEYRKQGIGSAFFQFIQDYVSHELNCRGMGFAYDADSPYAGPLESLLIKQGWPTPKFYLVRPHYLVQNFHPSWFEMHHRLKPEMEIFPWKEITELERRRLMHQADQGTFPYYLSPLFEEERIENLNSLGLRYQGRLIGWNITHRKDLETITYFSLYIEKEWHVLGYAIALLTESIRLQQQTSIPYALFEVNLNYIDASWWHFVKKRLLPYADRIEKKKWAFRVFQEKA